MATLTHCLASAFVSALACAHGAGKGEVGDLAVPALGRAVLSVLAGAARVPVRQGGGAGLYGQGTLAALLAHTVAHARPLPAFAGGGLALSLTGVGLSGAEATVPLSAEGDRPHRVRPARFATPAKTDLLDGPLHLYGNGAGQQGASVVSGLKNHRPRHAREVAHGVPPGHAAPPGWPGEGMLGSAIRVGAQAHAIAGTALAHAAFGGTARRQRDWPGGAPVGLMQDQLVAAMLPVATLLGRAGAPYGVGAGLHAVVAQRVRDGYAALDGRQASALLPLGFAASVLAQTAGMEGAGRAARSAGLYGPQGDYLHATSRAVGLASMVAPARVQPGSAVQAQITINAAGSSPKAIGAELERRMDTLRMQARQANMGQF